jgi:hypothetical protein
MEAEVLMCEVYGPLRVSLPYVTFSLSASVKVSGLWFILRRCQDLDHTTANGGDLEGSDYSLVQVLSWNLHGV